MTNAVTRGIVNVEAMKAKARKAVKSKAAVLLIAGPTRAAFSRVQSLNAGR